MHEERMKEVRRWWVGRLAVGAVLLSLLAFGTFALAQTRRAHQAALVRAWHRQYFHREPDMRSVAGWCYWFRLGRSEHEVLAGILSTDEYWRRSERSSKFVHSLFLDGAKDKGTVAAQQALLKHSHLGREALADLFLRIYPQALRPDKDLMGPILPEMRIGK